MPLCLVVPSRAVGSSHCLRWPMGGYVQMCTLQANIGKLLICEKNLLAYVGQS
jgi:hypothetical protein